MQSFSPTELLGLSDEEQNIVRCLSRTPHLTAAQIASACAMPYRQTLDLLEAMTQAAQLEKNANGSEATFTVQFRRERRPTRPQTNLLNLFDE